LFLQVIGSLIFVGWLLSFIVGRFHIEKRNWDAGPIRRYALCNTEEEARTHTLANGTTAANAAFLKYIKA
jgi:hypothetical protein